MASEQRCSKPGCGALKIVGKPCTDADCPQQWVHHTDTRPAPAATDTGLETVEHQYWRDQTQEWLPTGFPDRYRKDGFQVRELVTRSQAAELLAAERAENDEAYELGKRDGYSEAVQEIDLKTGGDGEYRYCTDHDPERHTPDPASMIQRIVERFETLNTMESVSEINEWKERAGAEADNAAKDARINFLERVAKDQETQITAQEVLEAKLAAAEKALEFYADASKWDDGYFKSEDDGTVLRAYPSSVDKDQGDKARAVLGGKPS